MKSFILLYCLCLLGCAATPSLLEVSNPPRAGVLTPIINHDRPVIAFVLGGGAARGFAHVGVLQVLEENQISADLVIGTSAGSVVGALYASGIRGSALMEAANTLDRGRITDWAMPNRGVVRGQLLQDFVNELVAGRAIEELEIPFVAVATELATGQPVAFNQGDAGMAVRASSAIPGLVRPVEIQGHEYVDGGLVNQVPVKIARQLGADIIIAVDVSRLPEQNHSLDTAFGIMQQALIIMMHAAIESETREADVLIQPDVSGISSADFEVRQQAIEAGKQAVRYRLPEIEKLILDKRRTKHLNDDAR